ncbi:hypothetical protein BFP72_03875 [Reichenbachiella sp. 5M10]|uniref:hypothetical protein n=1 Tax=Reichenbachiella sp. 5M10 TaxID=1889772 RepID=UPI000C157FED|nr:hypothetical protein [Reichenbachiella sp. 5M10]PIB34607.1 hypothetical protein BFP72_03875 [Reichenbachiella sp. 5M10]
MKISQYKVILLVFVLFVGAETHAKNNVEKVRRIQKTYTVKDFVKLNIENSFGKVHVNSTSGHTIDVKVEVIARRKNEERAMELLDMIEIEIDESSDEISFKTEIDGKLTSRSSESFEINYMVSMPRINPLQLKNSFGNAYVSDREGDVALEIRYGDVKVEKLNGDAKVKVSFGNGEFKYVAKGDLEIKYSDVSFEQLGVVRMEQGFSDVEIGRVKTMDLTSKYGEVDIQSVDGIKGYVGFSDMTIESLGIEMVMEASYSSSFEVEHIAHDFQRIELQGKFTSFELGFDEGANGTFEARVKFGDIDYSSTKMNASYRDHSDARSEYKGSIGSGKGGEVRVETSYGNIELR